MKFEQITVILNRECPRGCAQCGLADNSRRALSIGQWIEALQILRQEFGAWFFLFLGTEPLLFGERLATLVRWLNEEKLYYGFYSTSPEPLFTKYRQGLVDAGLRNWASGIDGLPGMGVDATTEKKIWESIAGLQWMAARGVQTHTLTTIHKKNYLQVPHILEWLQRNIRGVQSSVNFIEWKRQPEQDFFAPKEKMADLCWTGSAEEREEVRKMLARIKLLSRVNEHIIQTVDHYLDNAHLHYDKLDVHCEGYLGPAVDADGTLRLCGYSTGWQLKSWSVWDLPGQRPRFSRAWAGDLVYCPGCHWHYVDMVRREPRILNVKSGLHQERWCMNKVQYRKACDAIK